MQKAFGSMWRYPDCAPDAAWPNYKPRVEHHKHRRHKHKPFEDGIMKQTRLRIADNSKIGLESTAMGRPPKVIQVYTKRQGKLNDLISLQTDKSIIFFMQILMQCSATRFYIVNYLLSVRVFF